VLSFVIHGALADLAAAVYRVTDAAAARAPVDEIDLGLTQRSQPPGGSTPSSVRIPPIFAATCTGCGGATVRVTPSFPTVTYGIYASTTSLSESRPS
jgi:hypothetical protein